MKRICIILLFSLTLFPLIAWTPSDEPIKLGFLPITYIGLPDDYLYPTYLSDPLAVRSELGYKDVSYFDAYPDEQGKGSRTDAALGLRFNFFRFAPEHDPKKGIDAELGFMAPIYMAASGSDTLAFDGIYYFAISIKPFDWVAFRVSRHHISSHYGDEYDDGLEGNPYADFDTSLGMNMSSFVRDDFVFSVALYPLKMMQKETRTSFMLYGDYSLMMYGEDLLANRNTTPAKYAYVWYQFGSEIEMKLSSKRNMGSVFLAAQISAWQMNGFAPNFSGQTGYIFPRTEQDGQRIRLSLIYYDGQSPMNNFIYCRERYTGIVLTIDV